MVGGCREPVLHQRREFGEGMGDGGCVALAPAGIGEFMSAAGQKRDGLVDGSQLHVMPILAAGRQPGGGLRIQQFQHHHRPAAGDGAVGRLLADRGQLVVEPDETFVIERIEEAARQPIADRFGAGMAVPAFGQQALEFGAVGMVRRRGLIEHGQSAVAPERHEQRPVVQLDIVGGGNVGLIAQTQKIVADLARTGAEIETAVADLIVALAHQLARIGGLQLAVRRIDDARMRRRRQQLAPAGRDLVGFQRIGRGRRRGAAVRHQPGDRPADMALIVAGDEIQLRQAAIGGDVESGFDAGCGFQLDHADIGGIGIMGQPMDGIALAVHLADRPHRRLADQHFFGGRALHQDRLVGNGRADPVLAQPHHVGMRGILIEADDVEPIARGIGQAPADMPVAAGRDQRHARHADADDLGLPALPVGIDEHQAIPDRRQAQPEMHVIGHQGMTAFDAGACDHPIIAPGQFVLIGVPPGCLGRRRLGGFVPPVGRLRGHLEIGRRRRAVQRRVPAGSLGQQEGKLFGRGVILEPAQLPFTGFEIALQVEIEGPDHQQTVDRRPGARLGEGQQIVRRTGGQRVQPGIDAGGIAVEQLAVLVG